MDHIDRHAYSNRLRLIDPAQKGGLAVLAIGLCLLLDRPAVGLLTMAWMLALTTRGHGCHPARSGAPCSPRGCFCCFRWPVWR